MDKQYKNNAVLIIGLTTVLTIAVLVANASVVFSHGGKTHGDNQFTALQAVQQATGLYDRLIVAGKLDETWETGLASVTIQQRQANGTREYSVRFQRGEGEPDTVYFFFDETGQYAGSNFTGR